MAEEAKENTNENKEANEASKADASKEASKPQTYEVTIDGEVRQLSIEEMIPLASKAGGADKRFQEAAEIRKKAERGIRVQELLDEIEKGNPKDADIKELSGLLDFDSEEFMSYLNEDPNTQKDTNKDKNTNKQPDFNFETEFKKVFGSSPAEVKAILEHSQHRHVEDARKEIIEMTDKAVEKDKIIGKMIVGEDRDTVMSAVKSMVAKDVLRKIYDGGTLGADMIDASKQRVRQQLIDLGIPKKSSQQPIVLGLAPGGVLPSEIQADEPIDRVSSVDDKDEQNIIRRYQQKAYKALREKR
jgi:hypothetical protein